MLIWNQHCSDNYLSVDSVSTLPNCLYILRLRTANTRIVAGRKQSLKEQFFSIAWVHAKQDKRGLVAVVLLQTHLLEEEWKMRRIFDDYSLPMNKQVHHMLKVSCLLAFSLHLLHLNNTVYLSVLLQLTTSLIIALSSRWHIHRHFHTPSLTHRYNSAWNIERL